MVQIAGKASHEREKSSTHEMELRILHSLVSKTWMQGALLGVPRRDQRDITGAGGAQDGCEVAQCGTWVDHIHVCMRIPSKYAVTDMMEHVKRGKAHWCFVTGHLVWCVEMGKDRTFWTCGYYLLWEPYMGADASQGDRARISRNASILLMQACAAVSWAIRGTRRSPRRSTTFTPCRSCRAVRRQCARWPLDP